MSKLLKIILSFSAAFVLIFIIALAAIPYWISSPSGTQRVTEWINREIDGKISIEKIDLSWLGKQSIKNFDYLDEKGKRIASFNLFETDTSLLYLLLGGRSFNKTVVESPYLFYMASAVEGDKEEKERKVRIAKERRKITFRDQLLVNNGKIDFVAKNIHPITVSDIFIEKKTAPERVLIKALTSQDGTQGSLNINASLGSQLQAKIHIADFPIAILDQLCENSFFTEALGTKLNGDLNVEKKGPRSLNIEGEFKSSNLDATISGHTEGLNFILNPKTQLDFVITPALFKQLIDEKKRGDWELASKTNLMVKIEKGIFPLKSQKEQSFRDITLQGHIKVNRAELHHALLGSYSIRQFDVDLSSLNRGIEAAFQGEIQGKESTKLSGNVSVPSKREVLFNFTCEGVPAALLELLSVQLEKNVRLIFGSQFDMEGKGSYIDENLKADINVTSPDTELTTQIEGELEKLHFDATGTHHIRGNKAKVLGPSFNFTLKGVGNFEENAFSIPLIKGNAFNPYFDLDLNGRIGEEGKPFSIEQIQLISTGNIKKLPLEEDLPQATLQNGTLVIQVDGPKNLITGKAESQALDAQFEVHNFIHQDEIAFNKANVTFTCNLTEFPLAVISPFVTEDLDLTTFLGKTLSLNSRGSYTPDVEPRFSIDLNGQGAGFSTSLALAIDGTLLVRQNRPSYIYWELTPERYNALMRLFKLNPAYEPTFTLTRPTQVELDITQFICPTTPSKNLGHFICQSGFVGDLKIGTSVFKSKRTNEAITFQAIKGSINGENFSKAINLNLAGEISAENVPTKEQSAFSFEGQMFNFWTKQGRFNREGLSVKGVLSVDLIPVRQIIGIFPLENETRSVVQAVLGELINARIYGEISQLAGPLTVDIKSSNFKAKLPLRLQRNGIYLMDAVDAEITLTQAISETLLKDINPLLITGAYSDNPIKVHIDPQGFFLPLRPYSLAMAQIGSAVIDIGKIRVRNGGQLQSLMQFLNVKEITPDGMMEGWFTPIYMNVQNGVASYRRFDMLFANTVHIAMWGSINLVNNNVNMVLGIAPRTLSQRFKISGLSKRELFQVKMTGTTNRLELDWSAAQARIAFIVAKTAAGGLGSLIGGIIEQLVPKLGEEPSPPPTTDPLPWESFYSSDPRH